MKCVEGKSAMLGFVAGVIQTREAWCQYGERFPPEATLEGDA